MPWKLYVEQYNAAAKLAPKGIQKATVGFNEAIRKHAVARMAEVEDFGAIWQAICEYLPHDKHYNGSDIASREEKFKRWKVTLAYLVSPSGFSAAADRAIVWQDEQAEKERRAALQVELDRQEREALHAEVKARNEGKAEIKLAPDNPLFAKFAEVTAHLTVKPENKSKQCLPLTAKEAAYLEQMAEYGIYPGGPLR